MSQFVACVLLLAVEVLLYSVSAVVLDSACVSVCFLCIVAGSRGHVGLSCCSTVVMDSACVSVCSLCIVAGSRGPVGLSCYSSTGFSLCLSWFPVYCCWQ